MILAIDIGTSSTRTALFTMGGERLVETTAQKGNPLITTAGGGAELSPLILERTLKQCLRKTLAHMDGKVSAVGISALWHSFLGVGETNQPLTPIYTWADSRCREDAAALRGELCEKEIHARTGCMLRASFWPAKFAWLQRTHPKLLKRVRYWMSPAEWLQRQLVGNANCSLSMASGTGFFNLKTRSWDTGLLNQFAIDPGQFNPISDHPICGRVEEFPVLSGVPWFAAIGDGAASNLGCGATQPGLAAINVGTSAALRLMKTGARPKAPFGLFCYRVDPSRYLVGGASSNAGNLRAWCLRTLQLKPAQLEAQLAARPLPVHGLSVLPFWSAERAPSWNEDATGSIIGISHHTTPLDLFQAITEAGLYRIARIADLVLKT